MFITLLVPNLATATNLSDAGFHKMLDHSFKLLEEVLYFQVPPSLLVMSLAVPESATPTKRETEGAHAT
jgi:hypothetical protein